jgi:hypothetical protein
MTYREEHNRAMLALARQVAPMLGAGWTPGTVDEWFGAALNGPDGAQIWLSMPQTREGYVAATGSYPASRMTLRSSAPSANVRADRGAAAVAKAITSRVLPVYLPVLAEVTEYNAKAEHDAGQRQVLLGKMAAMFPGSHIRELRFGNDVVLGGAGGLGTVEASGSAASVTMTLRVPAAVALEVLELVAGRRAAAA